MVQELRWIMLDKQEVMLALEAHNRMMPDFMPVGKITSWDYIDQMSIRVVTVNPSGQEEHVFLEGDKLVQPLIRFCLENNIMLPLHGHKSISAGKSNISLSISLDIDASYFDRSPARLSQFALI